MPVTPDFSAFVNLETIDPADISVPIQQVATFANGLETAAATEVSNRTTGDNNLRDGLTAIERLVLGTPASVSISAGSFVATTKNRYIVDGAAASNDLTHITGLTDGQIVLLQIADNSRVVVVKHDGTGGFYNQSGADITLNNTHKIWAGIWNSAAARVQQISDPTDTLRIRELIDTTQLGTPLLSIPDKTIINSGYGAPRLALTPSLIRRNRFALRGAAAALVPDGVVAPIVVGTPVVTEANQDDSSYVNYASIVTINTVTGFEGATFNYWQRRHSPTHEWLIRTPADISFVRYWIGIFSARMTNVDDPALTTQVMAFRYSTVAADGGWRGVCDDGTTMSITPDLFPTLIASTPYLLRIRVDGSGGGTVYFSVNDSAELALTTNVPVAAQNLGFGWYVINQVAAARSLLFSRMIGEYN